MKYDIISEIQIKMKPYLNQSQFLNLTKVLKETMTDMDIVYDSESIKELDNLQLLELFLSSKKIEGCSLKTIDYYKKIIKRLIGHVKKPVDNITTEDLRQYLMEYVNENNPAKTTVDNVRRVFSSFFTWLEEENYILKNPMNRIHKVKTPKIVKKILTDEDIEALLDNCENLRDIALIEILLSTGMRVGELVNLDIDDVNFDERECLVFGKGETERIVYFDARCKLHLIQYLESREDSNPALFVSIKRPYVRLGINGVEERLKKIGRNANVEHVHPHKFRRTLATNAIDKGMPIEQVQRLLGHTKIDTTLCYAMVNQTNVKNAHKKFLG